MNVTSTQIYAHNLPEADGNFYTLGLLIERRLTADEALRAAGCLGYALSKMNGQTLSEPVSMVFTPASTYLTFWFDSTKCHRNSHSFEEAFAEAAAYIEQGTPVRRSNRAGPGTQGTRLVQGIGPAALTLSLDVDVDAGPRPTPPAISAAQRALDEAAARLNEAQQAYAQAAIAYAGAGL